MKKRLLIGSIILLVIANGRLSSQSVKRQSINSSGGSTYVDGKNLKHTAGQSSNTAEFKGEKITFRQGFQQAPIIFSDIKTSESCQLTLYPNPIISDATLLVPLQSRSYSVWICDMMGKVMYFEKNISIDRVILSAKDFTPGEYFIKVSYENGNNCSIKFIVIQ